MCVYVCVFKYVWQKLIQTIPTYLSFIIWQIFSFTFFFCLCFSCNLFLLLCSLSLFSGSMLSLQNNLPKKKRTISQIFEIVFPTLVKHVHTYLSKHFNVLFILFCVNFFSHQKSLLIGNSKILIALFLLLLLFSQF